jgi:general stress protein 26
VKLGCHQIFGSTKTPAHPQPSMDNNQLIQNMVQSQSSLILNSTQTRQMMMQSTAMIILDEEKKKEGWFKTWASSKPTTKL